MRARLRYRRFDSDLRRELEIHRALKEEQLRAAGLSANQARYRAAREVGNVTPQREDARRVWIAPWLESAWQDVRYALRAFGKRPGFAATVVLTLGAGIGLNVSLFAIFNVMALRTWDVGDPGSIVQPFARPTGNRGFMNAMSLAEVEYLRERTATLGGLIAWEHGTTRVFYGPGPEFEHVQLLGVSANFFDMLGIGLARGRGFALDEDTWGAPAAVTVISHDLWQRAFGADPSLVGRIVRLGVGKVPVTVIGVTRRGFRGLSPGAPRIDVFVPHALIDQVDMPPGEQDRLTRQVWAAGRLKPGVARAEAEAELNTLDRQFRAALALDGNGFVLTGTRPIGQPGQADRVVPTFAAFGGALFLVLLLACANVGNLQLARMMTRRREIAVRLSLGASRARVIRQLLTEATGQSLAAALLGFGLAWILPGVLLHISGEEDEGVAFGPDSTVLLLAMALGVATACLSALAPALRATRRGEPIVVSAREGIDRQGWRLRSLLLGCQVALSLTLLTGAGLLTRGLMHVRSMDLGFDVHETAYARVGLTDEMRQSRADREAHWTHLDAALRASSLWPVGVATYAPPLSSSSFYARVRRVEQDESWDRRAYARPLSEAGFDVLGLEFIAGGPYRDSGDARHAVINETLAQMLFPGEPAVGRVVVARPPVSGADYEQYTITGVVRDSYFTTPAEVAPLFHTPPVRGSETFLVFRTDRPDAANRLRGLLRGVDPRLRITVATVASNIDSAIEEHRFAAGLAWAIGGLGLSLATIGVFGVFAYAVEERRREIGIRVALGARARDVIRSMFVVNRWSVGGGVAAGLLLSAVAGFGLRSYLFGLSPLDPMAYLAVSVLLVAAAGLATLVPLRRAATLDPAVTLRSE